MRAHTRFASGKSALTGAPPWSLQSPGSANGVKTEESVPTVYFDLSEGAVEEKEDGFQNQELPSTIAAPTVAEHYGALLRREEQAREKAEAQLRSALEELRCARKQLGEMELEFQQEREQLQEIIREKDEAVAIEEEKADDRVQQERELMKAETARLRERLKQLNLCQKNLLKQVSQLVDEREELKRLLESRGRGRRSEGASLERQLWPPENGSSSSSCAVAPRKSFDRCLSSRDAELESSEELVPEVPDHTDTVHAFEDNDEQLQRWHSEVYISAPASPEFASDLPGGKPQVRSRSSHQLQPRQQQVRLRQQQQRQQHQQLQQKLLRHAMRQGYPAAAAAAAGLPSTPGSRSGSSGPASRCRSSSRLIEARSSTPPRRGSGLDGQSVQADGPPSFAELMALPLKQEQHSPISAPADAAAGQDEFLSSYVRHMRAYSRKSLGKPPEAAK
mmetsp:Transcript_97151/g.173039  ORF Transcript_97151/g.173039 Transcript_97151/m.173039 type:complete len:449 (+) Transcript_97151:92-1438(+)|eukprot:CAMPEP_0197629580 /NCGR_PEP_ID=MMETSP1338-20131121/7374_1 /TAXON_ID=43686 ORGANISM="Pelagodinium beii, Strain RCC1491" /NCGR_SAMPLE_ID=MMETSP1338 /ASSEMBLY_ACC=CAM_ASM_000754 /LENGTH=448 /DNA_ID=CAMNT_0043200645 /DNA_START=85 /DNA_END=1428 /DNA_ORIENTATION=+